MRRVTEVIDCWYDSGAMPFAQWGYPQQNPERFKENFPADFISEAIDQTRGWFYSQLAISTLLFGKKRAGTQLFLRSPAYLSRQLQAAGLVPVETEICGEGWYAVIIARKDAHGPGTLPA